MQFYEIAFRIDELIKEFSDESLSEIESYFNNKGIEKYFFSKLGDESINPNPWFKALVRKGYLNPNQNPKPIPTSTGVSIPYWKVLLLMKNVGMNNQGQNNNEMRLLLKVILSVINYQDENGQRIVNETTDYNLVLLMKFFPINLVNLEYIEFIRFGLKNDSLMVSGEIKEHILKFLLDNKAKHLVNLLIDIMFDYESKGYSILSIMDEDMLQESLTEFTDPIYKLCNAEAFEIALNKVKKITETSSIFDILPIDKDSDSYSKDYEIQILLFIKKYFRTLDIQSLNELLIDLIDEKKPIFKKIAISVINENYDSEEGALKLKNLFWEWEGNPLEVFGLRPEIFALLKSNYSEFTENENKILIDWIENIDINISEDEEEMKDQIEAHQKLRWLEAVKNSENELIRNCYEKYRKIDSKEIKHPDLYMYSEGLSAPAKPQELCKKSNQEIAEFLITSNKPEMSYWENGTYYSLEQCIRDDPKKFSTDLNPFLEIPIENQYYLLLGLYSALKNNKNFEWEELLDFILKIIKSTSFWEESNTEIFKYKDWIISITGDLIDLKTRNDDYPLNKNQFRKACDILMILAQNTTHGFDNEDNIINGVLNSTLGKIYSAMVNLSLSYARIYKSNLEDKWLQKIKEEFTARLKDPSVEFSVILGLYLPNLLFLDKNWLEENIGLIFNGKYWKCVFVGYLFTGKRIYETIYNLLRNKGFLEKAMTTDFNDRTANENIVFQIGTAFLFGKEDLNDDNSLIFKLIHNKTDLSPNQLSTIIRFCLTEKDQNYETIKPKIKPLWREIFNSVNDDPENYSSVLSDLSKLLIFFDGFDDEIYNWMKVSGKYLKINRNYRRVMTNLNKFVEDDPSKVADIFIVILKNDAYPDYPRDDIKNIVEEIYKNGFKESANAICNYYGANNDYSLRDLYKKYNFN